MNERSPYKEFGMESFARPKKKHIIDKERGLFGGNPHKDKNYIPKKCAKCGTVIASDKVLCRFHDGTVRENFRHGRR